LQYLQIPIPSSCEQQTGHHQHCLSGVEATR
jgi:hypothetical protein